MINSKTLNKILIGALVLLIIFIFVSLNIANSELTKQSATLVNLKASNAAFNNEQNQLTQGIAEVKKYSNLNQIAESVVPQDKDQAEAIREITQLASDSGIKQLSSITFTSSNLGSSNVKVGLTQVTPVKGLKGIYDLQITITQDKAAEVPYSSFIAFLKKIEQNRRTALVSSISITPDQSNTNMVSFTLVLNEYIKP